jgi:hypothetical protein
MGREGVERTESQIGEKKDCGSRCWWWGQCTNLIHCLWRATRTVGGRVVHRKHQCGCRRGGESHTTRAWIATQSEQLLTFSIALCQPTSLPRPATACWVQPSRLDDHHRMPCRHVVWRKGAWHQSSNRVVIWQPCVAGCCVAAV